MRNSMLLAVVQTTAQGKALPSSTPKEVSKTAPKQCSAIKKGQHVVIKGRPCKVIETTTSKTGKHGHAKVHMIGIDIFTGKKYEENCPSTHNMDVPEVNRSDYQLLDISDDGYASLMLPDGSTKDDLRVIEGSEVGDGLKAAFDEGKDIIVSVLSAMNEELIISWKEAPKSG